MENGKRSKKGKEEAGTGRCRSLGLGEAGGSGSGGKEEALRDL